jgi:hypothetical protein
LAEGSHLSIRKRFLDYSERRATSNVEKDFASHTHIVHYSPGVYLQVKECWHKSVDHNRFQLLRCAFELACQRTQAFGVSRNRSSKVSYPRRVWESIDNPLGKNYLN